VRTRAQVVFLQVSDKKVRQPFISFKNQVAGICYATTDLVAIRLCNRFGAG